MTGYFIEKEVNKDGAECTTNAFFKDDICIGVFFMKSNKGLISHGIVISNNIEDAADGLEKAMNSDEKTFWDAFAFSINQIEKLAAAKMRNEI